MARPAVSEGLLVHYVRVITPLPLRDLYGSNMVFVWCFKFLVLRLENDKVTKQ